MGVQTGRNERVIITAVANCANSVMGWMNKPGELVGAHNSRVAELTVFLKSKCLQAAVQTSGL